MRREGEIVEDREGGGGELEREDRGGTRGIGNGKDGERRGKRGETEEGGGIEKTIKETGSEITTAG